MSTATGGQLQHMDVLQPEAEAAAATAGGGGGSSDATAGRTASGGPASFVVDTLMGPETRQPQQPLMQGARVTGMGITMKCCADFAL